MSRPQAEVWSSESCYLMSSIISALLAPPLYSTLSSHTALYSSFSLLFYIKSPGSRNAPEPIPSRGTNDSVWFFTHGTWNVTKWKKKEWRLRCRLSHTWELGGKGFMGGELPQVPRIKRHRWPDSPPLFDFSAESDILTSPLFIKPSLTPDGLLSYFTAPPSYHPEHLRFL